MNVFSVLDSFLRATQDSLQLLNSSDDEQSSGSGSDSVQISINTISQDFINMPWFLTCHR